MINFNRFILISALAVTFNAGAQETLTNKKNSEYKFTVVKNTEATGVKNQGQTGTCWSFSTLSYFESELIRTGKGKDFNLSEMFVVRMTYPDKAENYVRMHGKAQFAEGGEFHDAVNVMKKYGMVPEEVYNGKLKEGEKYNHKTLDSIMLSIVKEAVKNEKYTDPSWRKKLEEKLDELLGPVPTEFEWKGKKYTPQSFAKEMGLIADDYTVITSFTHHPYYKKFVLEVPDNWAWEQVNNVPLNEMMETIDNALMNGHSVSWAADVSEPGFKHKEGLAIMPEKPFSQCTPEEIKAAFISPVPQMEVTPEKRQMAFDNYETQDDHAMHITGIVKDQNGKKYYIVKNSWGRDNNECDGYFYASEEYVKMKTTMIGVNKKMVPKAVAAKCGIR